jgi:arylamine N-acetyltransferase
MYPTPVYDAALFDRLLAILKLPDSPPSIDALREITRAFLCRIPFENISKLYYRNRNGTHRRSSFEEFLDGVVRYNLGGTCYTNNYYLHLLLKYLDYDTRLCGADMSRPDVHLVNVVTLDGNEYLVDAGYAAPFFTPMSLDLNHNWEFSLGRDRFVLCPKDGDGRSRMQMFRDGIVRHSYSINPMPRRIEEFFGVIDHSYTDEATFMNSLLLVRFFDNQSIAINNLDIIESIGNTVTVSRIADRALLPAAIERLFGIPEEISRVAILKLGELGDAWT